MKLKVLNYDKSLGKLSILLEDSSPAFANFLRRTMLEFVPTLAIETVEFKDNDGVLYDEMVAHRLGFIPLKTDLKSYTSAKDCKCGGEGCARCSLVLTLKAKGPKTVYASDIVSKDPKVTPVFPETPIVKLLKDQKLEFIATAVLGSGKDYTKWGPCAVWYNYQPSVTVSNSSSDLEGFKDKFPSKVFDKSGNISKKLIEDFDLFEACDGVNEDIVKVDWDENNIIFNIESWGQLSPKEILVTACSIIDHQLEDFISKL